ncbi:hypothetical protein FIBSPDRAFT_727338 [Athelia psychrophila]|uniref:Uncharacterized protein n=1 Tax=Athelia psychrophila TaxID=1759441 RepID=A0A166SG19_9AGAM|nr:hypothetical protein FIBSPDRAFT_727338 [Fibularhizoctonia sp. CBS 109695]
MLKLQSNLAALSGLSISTLVQFISCAAHLKDDILLTQPADMDASMAPEILPPGIRTFLGNACDIPLDCVDVYWLALKETVWQDGSQRLGDTKSQFQKHGHNNGIGIFISGLHETSYRANTSHFNSF